MRLKSSVAASMANAMAWACLLASAASHADVQTTVPNAYAGTPGTGVFLGPLANTQRTYQLLINQNQLGAHLGSALSSLTFRLPPSAAAAWPASTVNYANYDIRISEGVAPASRSLTFEQNVVGAQTLVRSGALTITPASFSNGATPNAFGMNIDFDSDYQYGGGHLLIEIRHNGSDGTSQSLDALLTGSAAQGYGSLFSAAWTGNYAGTAGIGANFAVLQIASVPEPASALLLAAGVLGLVARQRARAAHA